MSTTLVKPAEVERKWYLLDAAGKSLGHVAAEAAVLLRGKQKVDYTPNVDCGEGIVEIKGMPCPVLGRVCMDQIMVDVSALPDVQEGDEAILWGGEVSDSAETIAHKTDTISYEVLCGVSRRVPRVYLENGGIKAVEDWIL